MRLLLIALLWLTMFHSANAAWEVHLDDDPLDDSKVGLIIVNERSGISGIGFKCWENDLDELTFMFFPGVRYDDSANYKRIINIKWRIDRREVRELQVFTSNLQGKLTFSGYKGLNAPILEMLSELRRAKERIVVAVENAAITFPARNSTKAVDALANQCGLELPKLSD